MKSIKLWLLAGLVLAPALVPPSAFGQKATEKFIALGKSPGLSGKYTVIGELEQFDAQNRMLTVASSSGKHTCQLNDKTKIWLDRTKLKQPNLTGTVADLKKGRRVEIKHEDAERKAADWIKVEITSGSQ
jgi:hypothetical protein